MNTTGRNVTFPIYNADGTAFNNLVLHKATYDSVVMSLGDKITGDVYYPNNHLAVTMQEYIVYDDVKYVLVNPPTIVREGVVSDNADLNGMTKYSFEFYHPMYKLGDFPFTDVAVTQSEEKYLSQNKTFSWIGNLFDFVNKIKANLSDTLWSVRCNISQYESDGVTETSQWQKANSLSEVLSFDKNFVSDALKTAYETWEIPFTIGDFDEIPSQYTRLSWVAITSISQTVSNRTSPFFLFIKNLDAVGNDNRVYYCKVYDGDTMVMNLIPCKYQSTVGMYDSVNDVFYGSGVDITFTAGEEIGSNKKYEIVFGEPSTRIYDSDGNEFVFQFGQGLGLKNNSRTPKNNKIVTRIAGYGSEGNIPYGYPQIQWYGDQTWGYTINNDSTNPNSYPIYNGIVDGRNVRLIKHPFTRTTLMPSIYTQTVFNKVSPYDVSPTAPAYNQTLTQLMQLIDIKISQTNDENVIEAYNTLKSVLTSVNNTSGTTSQSFTDSATQGEIYDGYVHKDANELIDGYVSGVTGDFEFESVLDLSKYTNVNANYDPDTKIIDYYDADNTYPNPIVPNAPSFEMHQFEDIKPRLGDAQIAGVSAYYTPSEVPQYMSVAQVIVAISDRLNTEIDVPNERSAVYDLRAALIAENYNYSDSKQGGSYNYQAYIKHDEYFIYVSFQSSIHSFEYTALYADSYPVVWDDTMDDDGNYKQSYFKLTLPQLTFDIYACASITEEMQINMRSGACIGCTFNVQVDWEDYKSVFYDDNGNFDPDGEKRQSAIDRYPYSNQGQITVIVAKDTETFGTLMPNIYQQPHIGDKFVILGISLPLSYIILAEEELDDAMREYMLENNVYHYEYPLKFDEYFLATHTDILSQMRNNTIVRFQYAQEPTMALYIKQITIKYGDTPLPQYDITLTDDVEIVLNSIGQVTDDVSRMRVQVSELQKYYQQNIIDIINTKLDKVVDDVCQGKITFQQGLNALGDVIFSADAKSSNFSQGLYDGRGWKIDSLGNADFESVRVRSYLEVVELLINRLQAQEGDTLFTDNDMIDSVEKITYNGTNYYLLSLNEKWSGYITSQQTGNIVKGIINTLAAKYGNVSNVNANDQGTVLDGSNSYYTSWMLVVDAPTGSGITVGTNQILVILWDDAGTPAGKNFEPCELMTIARWGCQDAPSGATASQIASVERRQRLFSISTTDGRITKLRGVNSPILREANYGTTLGIIPDFINNWSIHSRLIAGRDYLYAQGIIVGDFIKVDVNGDPIVNIVDRGTWQNNTVYRHYEYNSTSLQWETDDVFHNNARWRCRITQPIQGVYYEPTDANSQYWEKLEEAVDGLTPNVNMLLRTVFDNGLDFIKEKWNATHWDWVSMDSSQDTQYIEGHQSLRFVIPAGSGNDTMFYQSVLGILKPNTWYTFSFNLFASKNITFCIHNIEGSTFKNVYTDGKVIVDGVERTGVTNTHNDVEIQVPTGGTLWDGKRHYITFKTNSNVVTGVNDTLKIGWYFLNQSADAAQNFVLCMPKLEEGEYDTTYIANEDDLIGEQGEQGDSIREVSIYKWAGTQPQKPTSTAIPPSGWTLKPYPSWHFEGVADSAKSVVRIPITTTVANATVTLKAVAHSEEEYDFVVLGDLDSTALETDTAIAISEACQESSSAYGAYTSGDGGVATRQYTIAAAGSHFICIAYAKNSSNSDYGDYADVEMTQFSEKLWKCVGTAVNGVLTSDGWSAPVQENGIDGERGKIGRFFYYAQVWSNSSAVSYLVSDAQAPFFSYNNNYWVFNPEVNGTYTMAQMGEPSSQSSNWQIMTNDFKYLITEAIFGQYAHFGGLIINGDWMLSEYGMRNGSESTAYTYFDVSFPKGSMVLANNVTLDLDEDDYPIEQQFSQWLEAGRSYIFTIVVNNSTSDEAKIVLDGDTYTAQGTTSFTFEPSTSMTYVLSAETLETHSVNISISIVLEDAFIPNYAVDMRRGKTYIQNADVSGNVEAAKIVAANEDMITTIQAGVLKVSSTKSASYGIFSVNSLNEVILQMYDKDGKLVTSLGGSPTYFVSGKWTQHRWKSLGTTLPAVATTANYTAYDNQCSNYYELTLGKQMDNSGNILNYYLPDNSSPLPQGDSRIAEDGKTFRSHTINSSYYIPDGYYIAPNNGNFPQFINPKTGDAKAFVSVLHHTNGIVDFTLIIELSEVANNQ